jgi:hypothetical protein
MATGSLGGLCGFCGIAGSLDPNQRPILLLRGGGFTSAALAEKSDAGRRGVWPWSRHTMSTISKSSPFYVVHDNMRSHYGLPVFMSPDYGVARHYFDHYQPEFADSYYEGDPMVQIYEYMWMPSGELRLRMLDQRVR